MENHLNYFVFNKKLDYDRGFFSNMEYDASGFWIKEESEDNCGFFISRVLDSKEQEMEWHRLTIQTEKEEYSSYRIYIYASDISELEDGNIKKVIKDTTISMEEKLARFKPYCQREETGRNDILLHGIKGRYLWIVIEAYRQYDENMKMEQIQIYFPKQTWMDYLPEVYQANDDGQFLDRYLSIFETIYDDLNKEIKDILYLLDISSTTEEYLNILGKWLGISQSYMWSESKKRKFLKRAFPLFKIRGTRKGMLEILKTYLEDEVFLVEKTQWNQRTLLASEKKQCELLYGTNPYLVTVLVKEESTKTMSDYKALMQLIESIKPAQVEVNLVVLRSYIFLGGHSYLEINSELGKYRTANLDGQTVVPFVTIGGEKQRKER